ncbi:MAG: 50S ribosome-binding GTPase [Kiritimatiellae bacterium]|nr:50S ribosome-binding GTPase [Kiritimatiellia bacterium]
MSTEKEQLQQSLIRISAGLSALSGSLRGSDRKTCGEMVSLLDRSIIPQLAADCPLLVAVTGGGSTGKSTIFNLLAGKQASAADPRAGFTRRMVAAIHPKVAADTRKMELLFERFRANAHPSPLENADEALSPGDPVYVECPDIPEHLVLIDTPDFDTGTREGFTNRDAAKEILDVADVVLYVATNATYNNKSSTDFVRSVLSEVGLRKVALLYRFSPVYPDDMVREHMAVVLSNLYPDESTARDACIGIWRIDESNEVAAGIRAPEIKPLAGGVPLGEALATLDPTITRAGVMRSQIDDCLDHAEKWHADAKVEKLKFEAYRDSLKYLTSKTSLACLQTAPQRDILRLFVKEWEAAQPWLVRNGHGLSRGTIEMMNTAKKWVKRKIARKPPSSEGARDFALEFRNRFLEKAEELRKNMLTPPLKFEIAGSSPDLHALAESLRLLARADPSAYGFVDCGSGRFQAAVARPNALSCVQDGVEAAKAGDMLRQMADRASATMGELQSILPDVRALVREIRNKMSRWQRCGEWVSASLDSVAIAGALTFVIFNPPVAVAGASAPAALLSLFGINDLVAVPALGAFMAAHSKIDRTLVDAKMNDLYTLWASEKARALQKILEESVSGGGIAACDKQCKRLDEACGSLEAVLGVARGQAEAVFSDAKGTVRQEN